MKTRYSIELPGAVKSLPNEFKNIPEVFSVIRKMFKLTNFHFCIIYENGKYFKKVINPKFRRVTDQTFLNAHNTGMFTDAFILNENGEKQYYLNDGIFYKNKNN
jgi:hypothetical protein